MPNKFSDYTKKIQSKLPYWFKKMKEDDESIGAQFLNIFGLAIEDVQYMLTYAYEQCRIDKIDVDQIERVYKAILPISIDDTYNYSLTGGFDILTKVDTIQKFLSSLDDLAHIEIHYPHPYLINYKSHEVFVRYPYSADVIHKYGSIILTIRNDEEEVMYNAELELTVHPVWNFFDEFGLLLSTSRLFGESNALYKERLLDVFKHPTGASALRMVNGIGRELGLRKNYTWADGKTNYTIEEKMVIVNSIEVNNVPIDESLVYINSQGNVVLLGDISLDGVERSISFVYGFAMHELHNKSDMVLQNQIDGIENMKLKYIVDTINNKAPVLWGHFVWDEAFWDTENTFTSSLPMRLDALYS